MIYRTNSQIIKALKKDKDELAMKFLIRPLSIPLSLPLIKYTNVTPNHVTVFAFVLVLISAIFFFFGGYFNQIIGGILSFLYIVFDCVDGNIARVKKLKSLKGRWLDGVFGFISYPLIVFTLLWGNGDLNLFVLGLLAIISYPMQYLVISFYKFRIVQSNEPTTISRKNRFEFMRYIYGSALFFPLLLLAVFFKKIVWLVFFYATFGNLFWILILILQYREMTFFLNKRLKQ